MRVNSFIFIVCFLGTNASVCRSSWGIQRSTLHYVFVYTLQLIYFLVPVPWKHSWPGRGVVNLYVLACTWNTETLFRFCQGLWRSPVHETVELCSVSVRGTVFLWRSPEHGTVELCSVPVRGIVSYACTLVCELKFLPCQVVCSLRLYLEHWNHVPVSCQV